MAELSYLQDVNPKDERIFAILKTIVVDKKPLAAGYERLIHKCSLFGHQWEPSRIWEHYGRDQAHVEQLLFLSELNRSGKNISRKIGRDGTWSESASKEIKGNTNHNPIGRKRNFRFENKCKSGDNARWLLEEYSLYDAAAAHDNTKASKNRYDFDFVICKMRRNRGENKRKHSNDPNTNNVEEPQMAETLEDVPSRSVGFAWVGADEGGPLHPHHPLEDHQLKDHQNVTVINAENTKVALDSDPYQMDGNQEKQLPLLTAGSASLDIELGGAIEANYQSNDLDEVFYQPFAYGTSNCHFKSLSDIELDSDPYQMDGNQEKQLPLLTAGSAWLDVEDGGEIEANYQIPNDYLDKLLNLPFADGTNNYCSELLCDIPLWNFSHQEY